MSWIDEKGNPDRTPPSPHEIDASQRAADHESVENAFTHPQDGLDRIEEFGLEPTPEAELGAPTLADQLDHAGLEDQTPEDHPTDAPEEPSKPTPPRWGKSP